MKKLDGCPQFFLVVDQEKNSLDNLKFEVFSGLSKGSLTEKMRKGWIGFLLDYEKKSRWNFKWILFYEELKKIRRGWIGFLLDYEK